MAKSFRFVRRGIHGRNRQNFNIGGTPITLQSVINITAGEIKPSNTSIVLGGHAQQNFQYHLGDANVWISNVSPHEGGVEFIINVDWPSPLDIGITITVEDDTPLTIQN